MRTNPRSNSSLARAAQSTYSALREVSRLDYCRKTPLCAGKGNFGTGGWVGIGPYSVAMGASRPILDDAAAGRYSVGRPRGFAGASVEVSAVLTGLRIRLVSANPTLKRGANNHCAYGAGEVWLPNMEGAE